MIFAQKNR